MSDEHKDVLIAVYLFEDLAEKDFNAVLKLAEDKTITVRRCRPRPEGRRRRSAREGDRRPPRPQGREAGRRRRARRRPVRAAAPRVTAVGAAGGAVLGKFAKHRLESGIAEKMDAALPNGSGGVIAVYDSAGAEAVAKALTNAVKTSVAQIDGAGAKELKAGLAEAQAGMGG